MSKEQPFVLKCQNMPELPEVESLRRGLIKNIVGSKILNVEILQEKIVAGNGTKRIPSKQKTKEFIQGIKNKKIFDIDRNAKNLIFKIGKNKKAGPSIILVHLKMTGQLVFVPKNKKHKISFGGHPIEETTLHLPHKHTYIIFELNNGNLYYNDVRQFGYVLFFKNLEEAKMNGHLQIKSVEPFSKDFTYKYFKNEILKKNKAIKKVFLGQEIVNGLGNIYSDEVCFASSVSPLRICKTLKEKELKSLYKNIKSILKKAVLSGGSSVANYLLADGKRGNYTDYHRVYQKQNTRCTYPGCLGVIKKISFAGRGTHFCPTHQK